MHGRDRKGAVASLTSVAKLRSPTPKMGSYTFLIVPAALGKEDPVRKTNLVGLLDGYFHHEADVEGGQHLNVNVMNRKCCWMPSSTRQNTQTDNPCLWLRRALQRTDP